MALVKACFQTTLSHLGGCKRQFLQSHFVSLLHLHHLVPLVGQEGLEGGDELQIGGGSDVVMSP